MINVIVTIGVVVLTMKLLDVFILHALSKVKNVGEITSINKDKNEK